MSELCVGVVGVTEADLEHTLPALLGLPANYRTRLVAVVDPRAAHFLDVLSSPSGRRAAAAAGHPYSDDLDLDAVAIHEDSKTMLERSMVNAVIVSGPQATKEICADALRNKCDVLTDAGPLIADPDLLSDLRGIAVKEGQTFLAGHLSGYRSSLRDTARAAHAIRVPSAISARWCVAPEHVELVPSAARLVALTTPVAVALNPGAVTLQEMLPVDGARVVRGIWTTQSDTGPVGGTVEIEVERGWRQASGAEARLTARSRWGNAVELSLVPPGAEDEPSRDSLRPILRKFGESPVVLDRPPALAGCHRSRVMEWASVCTGYHAEARVTTEQAIIAAQMAQDLVRGLQGWTYDRGEWTEQ